MIYTIKTIGIMLVSFTAIMLGFYFSVKEKSKITELEKIDTLLGEIIFKISEKRISVSDILLSMVGKHGEKTDKLLEKLSKTKSSFNSKNIIEIFSECGFSFQDEINEIIKKAFTVLGKISAKEQVNELKRCREMLREKVESERKSALEKIKLYRSFGFLSGALAVIILL